MKWLAIGVAVVAAVWSGWWFLGATAFERGAVAGIEAARTEGWRIDYADLSVSGFPNRFDTTVDAPRVTAPDGSVTWSAPFLQVFALSYRPNRFIAVAPREMVLDVPAGRLDIGNDDLRGSAAISASTRPELLRATVAAQALTLSGAGLDGRIDTAQLALRQIGGATEYDVALGVSGIEPGEALRAVIDPFEALPATISTLDIDLHATLDRALEADPEGMPRITALDFRAARLVWGELRVSVTGLLEIDADGVPEGTLTLDLRGWQSALRLAVSLGLLPVERLPLLSAGLAAMAEADGSASMDLVFADGQMRLGLVPLGPAPRL